jgi:hypothetical protein
MLRGLHCPLRFDPGKPAIDQLGDGSPGFVVQRDIGGDRTRPAVLQAKFGTAWQASERRENSRPPQATRQKRGLRLVAEKREQPLQRAIEQGRMDQIIGRLVDRRSQPDSRSSTLRHDDLDHRMEGLAVIETEPGSPPIEHRAGHVPTIPRTAPGRQQRFRTGGDEAAARVQRHRLVRETLAARQLPIALGRHQRETRLARFALGEREGAQPLDIGHVERGGHGVPNTSRGERHVEDCRRGQHRHAVDTVIAEHWVQRHVEMIDP